MLFNAINVFDWIDFIDTEVKYIDMKRILSHKIEYKINYKQLQCFVYSQFIILPIYFVI